VTERVVAVLAQPSPSMAATLPAKLADRVVAAMLEDVVDLVTDTPMVGPALAVVPGFRDVAEAFIWPGTLVVDVVAAPTVAAVLAALAQAVPDSAVAVAVVVPDVPDLPTLLLGKLFSALAGPRGADVAVCPAQAVGGLDFGGLVAVAANLPLPNWLVESQVSLDDTHALEALRGAAPRGALSVGPGWHRIRRNADLDDLDPGLEGWEATRAYLRDPGQNDAPSLSLEP
jgi:hypothetical protein